MRLIDTVASYPHQTVRALIGDGNGNVRIGQTVSIWARIGTAATFDVVQAELLAQDVDPTATLALPAEGTKCLLRLDDRGLPVRWQVVVESLP